MSKFGEIIAIKEIANPQLGSACGVYNVAFNGKQEVFVRNGDSVAVIAFFYGSPAEKCMHPIRDDVKEEFFRLIGVI